MSDKSGSNRKNGSNGLMLLTRGNGAVESRVRRITVEVPPRPPRSLPQVDDPTGAVCNAALHRRSEEGKSNDNRFEKRIEMRKG
jgi:hypothetical protein